jgi:ornithine--oxo-acid transaminase
VAQYRDDFGPYGPGFKRIDFDDPAQLERAITADTVAFLVEPIQAEAGIIVPTQGYLAEIRAICRRHDVLLILDEIQTGLGRTGKLFAYEHERNAAPDLLILGKALGGGVYPVAAVLGSDAILGVLQPGDHGSTFGGNPLASAVASAALDVTLDEQLSERAAVLGERLRTALERIDSPHVKEIRGRGLLIGVEFHTGSGPAKKFALRLLERGVLSKDTHEQVLRLAPPLVIEESEIDWLVAQLAEALR